MKPHIYLKNFEVKEKTFLENYLSEKIGRLEKLCQGKKVEPFSLEVKAEHFAKKAAFRVEFIVILAGRQFLASEDDHTTREALDLAFDKLIKQIRAYFNKEKEQQK